MHTTILKTADNNDWPQWLNIKDPKLAAQLTEYELNLTAYLWESSNQRQMFKKLDEEIRALGFSQFGFLLLRSKYDAEDFVWSYPARDRSFYTIDRLYERDLLLEGILKNKNNITEYTQSMVEAQLQMGGLDEEVHETNIEIISSIKQFAINDYYDIAVPLLEGGKAVLSVAARYAPAKEFRLLAEKHRAKLAVITQCACHVGSTKFKVSLDQGNPALRPNSLNLQILDCLANEDLQLGEIASYLGISDSQVNKKLAEIKKVLGVRNTTFAVTQALRRGLIHYRR